MGAPKSSARGAGATDDASQRLPLTVKVKAISHPHRPENMMQNVRQYPQFSWAHRRSSPRWITCVIGRKDGSRGSSRCELEPEPMRPRLLRAAMPRGRTAGHSFAQLR